MFFEPQTTEALEKAIVKFDSMKFDETAVRQSANNFSNEEFKKQMFDFVSNSEKKRAGNDTN